MLILFIVINLLEKEEMSKGGYSLLLIIIVDSEFENIKIGNVIFG